MTGWLTAPAEELFGEGATAEESYQVLTVEVPLGSWIPALETARTTLGCTYFDWLSAVDEPGTGFRLAAHVVAVGTPVRRLLLRTLVPHEEPVAPTAVGVYAGATWHERETHEMFGVVFEGHPGLDKLLLPENFEGHPLRKDFVLAARVAKAWPGAKEPGESDHGGPKRRQMLPPGVPDPNEWGPLKGQLPPAPARPARGAGRAAGAAGRGAAARGAGAAARGAAGAGETGDAAGERPVRRSRTAAGGSASQTAGGGTQGVGAEGAGAVGAGAGAGAAGVGEEKEKRGPKADGAAAAGPVPDSGTPAGAGPAAEVPEASPGAAASSSGSDSDAGSTASDAPWHHARLAFEDSGSGSDSETSTDSKTGSDTGPESDGDSKSDSQGKSDGQSRSDSKSGSETGTASGAAAAAAANADTGTTETEATPDTDTDPAPHTDRPGGTQ
ncbi:NADH-quinone oxidoreductase subunit C [Streptomyces physcomitrii]|uniref:NADH-quinone oxidoreductase subunit C n=1 Tax=Streptomyces physcomitrii TaxID=2724184 RepID=A0ABX1H0C5_9ACTN|nr:NADH-quinone oxidoreductase subunit C [Streptomyces physcomitrii]NKI40714.1 NADH-quinone oxidoreductase subunit C [Streptomyces physcomitrii]